METRKLIEAFPKGSPPIQIDILKAIDHYIGLENIHEIDTDKNFTLIMGKTAQIFISKRLPSKAKHFVLTHEFVEYFTEKEKPFASFPYYIYKGEDKRYQSRINNIAGQLLMPEWVLKDIVDDILKYGSNIDNSAIRKISDFFLVSEKAVQVRLKSLGYEVSI